MERRGRPSLGGDDRGDLAEVGGNREPPGGAGVGGKVSQRPQGSESLQCLGLHPYPVSCWRCRDAEDRAGSEQGGGDAGALGGVGGDGEFHEEDGGEHKVLRGVRE